MAPPPRGVVVVGIVLVAACLALVLWLHGRDDRTLPETRIASGVTATAPESPAVQAENTVQRVAAGVDRSATFQVVEADTSRPLDGVRLGFGRIGRLVDPDSLIDLGTTAAGSIIVPMARLAAPGGDERIVLTAPGHLPLSVRPPAEPGVYVLSMTRGKVVTARVVDATRAPVPDAQVTFFARNVDASLLVMSGTDRPGKCIAGEGDAWFVSVPCDLDGNATAAVPEGKISVLGDSLGWFPVSAMEWSVDEIEPERAIEIVLAPVRCAVLASRPARILGRTFCTFDSRSWRSVHNIYAFAAKDRIIRVLSQRFAGDLVIVECLEPARGVGRDVGEPEARLRVLVDGQGESKVAVTLARFTEVRLSRVHAPGPGAAVPLGGLGADAVPGCAADWRPSLYAVPEGDERAQMAIDLPFGETWSVPAGRYQVFQRRLGGSSETEVGAFEVLEGKTCRVEAERLARRWPVVLRVADEHGASPRFSSLRIRERDSGGEWRVSPRDPARFEGFLEEGTYDVLAATDGKTWQPTEVAVFPRVNRLGIAVKW